MPDSERTSVVQVRGLKKSYNLPNETRLEVLRGIDLDVFEGEIVSITGESGSGKSTLLHILGTLDTFNEGTVDVCGYSVQDLHKRGTDKFRNQNLGFIFQFHYLLPDFSALENVAMPMLARAFLPDRAYRRAAELLSLVGLSERLTHFPNQLSGGEQQRVAIARALVNSPRLVLADEPTGNLDENNAGIICDLLWQLRDELGLTIVLVTHNVGIAERATRRIHLSHGQLAEKSATVSSVESGVAS